MMISIKANLNSFVKLLLVFAILKFTYISYSTDIYPKDYNVLLISVDDINSWIGAWGGIADTPNIDQLAKEGIPFLNAYCVAPACNPSRVALLTGLRPERTGVYMNFITGTREVASFRKLAGGMNIITLPQLLKLNGYKTVSAGKIFHRPRGVQKNAEPLSDPESWTYQHAIEIGTPRPSEYFDQEGIAKWLMGKTRYEEDIISNYLLRNGAWGPIDYKKEECGDWKVAEFGANFLKEEHNKPFLLALGISRPHSPQFAPAEYFERYPIDSISLPKLKKQDLKDIPNIAQTNFSSSFAKTIRNNPKEFKRAIQGYLASCSFADDCVGLILNALEKSQYKDNTIVVFFSDHGWQHGQKNRWEKQSLWKLATHTPMIIRYPHQNHSNPITQTVSLLDIYPTIIDLISIHARQDLDGNSLKPLLQNSDADWHQHAVITYGKGNHSVINSDWNYIQYENGEKELYNLLDDPNEWHNLAKSSSHFEIINHLKTFIPAD